MTAKNYYNDYLPTYAENVFPAAREAITTGKFHDMFMAGDGHELEDYIDRSGYLHRANAKAVHSSSMLAYNFFHWVSPEHPLTWNGITYDKVYFEVKFPVMVKSSNGRPINRPSNMDVVLISHDCETMLCIESKYTEHTHRQPAEFADAYFMHDCYYQGNPFIPSFIHAALHYNEKKNGYYAGIKQNVSHLIGVTNICYDADALAWFRDNNPFIEPEVMEKICSLIDVHFINLLYIRPEDINNMYGNIHAPYKTYPCMLAYFQFDHCSRLMREFLPYGIFTTYPELFAEVRTQMPSDLADYLDSRYNLVTHGIPAGFHELDEITSGWQKQDLIVIAARPSVGKTAFGLSMAKNLAIDRDIPIAFFSLEMSKKQLMKRLIMNVCELDGESLKTGKLTEEETQRINTMINATKAKPLFLDDTSALSVTELRAKARKQVHDHGVKLIIIDYLQLLTAKGLSFSNREEEVSIITHSLKALAKELDIPIIALTQLNRCLDARNGVGGNTLQLTDIRESGAIEQDADMVCFIHRSEDLPGLAEFIVVNHRNDTTDTIRLRFSSKYAKFENNN